MWQGRAAGKEWGARPPTPVTMMIAPPGGNGRAHGGLLPTGPSKHRRRETVGCEKRESGDKVERTRRAQPWRTQRQHECKARPSRSRALGDAERWTERGPSGGTGRRRSTDRQWRARRGKWMQDRRQRWLQKCVPSGSERLAAGTRELELLHRSGLGWRSRRRRTRLRESEDPMPCCAPANLTFWRRREMWLWRLHDRHRGQ